MKGKDVVTMTREAMGLPPDEYVPINVHTVAGRQAAFEKFNNEQGEILIGKGHDYTAGQAEVDSLHNFRELGKMLGLSPYTVCMVYAMKHLFSLLTFNKTGKQESGEGLRGRHIDLCNYGFILNELVPDHINFMKEQNDG